MIIMETKLLNEHQKKKKKNMYLNEKSNYSSNVRIVWTKY